MPIDVGQYYEKYGPMVLRRCRVLLKHEEMARDAMHDVFVNLLDKSATLDERSPSSLLYRIATNVCLNRIRSTRVRPEDGSELLERIAHAVDVPSNAAARSVLQRLFGGAQQDSGAMAVMLLHDGMTLSEVALEYQMSVSGVRKRMRSLRLELRELLEVV